MTDLFSYEPRPPNYRPSDPITSRDAGRSAHSFTAEHHQAILNVLRRAGRAMAPEEISDAMKSDLVHGKGSIWIDTVGICKRVAELIAGNAVERTAEQHVNRSRRKAFRIRIKQPRGEAASSTG
jgi:hypothetical protein